MCIVTWEDYDGTVLETSVFPIWSVPVYSWGTPTRASTAQYDYTFDDWNPQVDQVWNNTETYVATYTQSVRNYTITWENYDWTVLDTDSVAYGDTPSYSWATPTKPSDAEYDYTFDGWDPQISAVTWDATYTATFTATPIPEPFIPENSILIEAIVPEEEEPEEEPIQTRGGPLDPGHSSDNQDAGNQDVNAWEWEEETQYRVKFFATDESSEDYIRAVFAPSEWALWEREYFWACDSQKFYDMQGALSLFTSEFVGGEWRRQFNYSSWYEIQEYLNNAITSADLESSISDILTNIGSVTETYLCVTWVSVNSITLPVDWSGTMQVYYSPESYSWSLDGTQLSLAADYMGFNTSIWTCSGWSVDITIETPVEWTWRLTISDNHGNSFEVTVIATVFTPVNRVRGVFTDGGGAISRRSYVDLFLNAENTENYIRIQYNSNDGSIYDYQFNWLSNTANSWQMLQDGNISTSLMNLLYQLNWDYVFDSTTWTYIANYFNPESEYYWNTHYLNGWLTNSTWMEPAPAVTCISASWTTMYLGYYSADFLISNIADPNEIAWSTATSGEVLDVNSAYIDDNWDWTYTFRIDAYDTWTDEIRFYSSTNPDDVWAIFNMTVNPLTITDTTNYPAYAWNSNVRFEVYGVYEGHLWVMWEDAPDNDILDFNDVLIDDMSFPMIVSIPTIGAWTANIVFYDPESYDEVSGTYDTYDTVQVTVSEESVEPVTVVCESWTEIVNHTGSLELLVENFPEAEEWQRSLSRIGLDIEDYNVLDSASAQMVDNWDWTATIIVPTLWEWTSNVTVYDTAYDDGEGGYDPEGIWRSETVEVISGWTRIVCPTCQWTWQYYDESIWETVECMDCWWAWWRYEEPAPAPIVHAQWEACETCAGTWAVSHNNELGQTVFEPCPDCNWFWYFTWATAPTMYIDADHSTVTFGDPELQEYGDDISMTLLEYCESDPNACGPEENGLPSMIIDWDENWWSNPTDWNSDPIEHIIPIICWRWVTVSPQEFDHTNPEDWWWELWSRAGTITLEVYWSWDWETREYSWESYDEESWESIANYSTNSGTISNSHVWLAVCWVNYYDNPAAGMFENGGDSSINLWSEENSGDPNNFNVLLSVSWSVTVMEPMPPEPEMCPDCAWSWMIQNPDYDPEDPNSEPEITCPTCGWSWMLDPNSPGI